MGILKRVIGKKTKVKILVPGVTTKAQKGTYYQTLFLL